MNQQLLDQARELHRAGRLDDAIAAYQRLTDDDPAVAEVWRLRAMAEHQGGRLEAARGSIARSLELDAGQAAAHLVHAHIAEDAGDRPLAEGAFRRAAELRPDWAAAWNGLGTRLLDDGKPTEALAAFQKAVDAAPAMVRSWNNLGLAQLALERLQDAERAFNHAVGLDPRYALPHFNLARLHDFRGEAERALAFARQAAQLDPRHGEAHLLIGDLLRRSRDMRGAEQAYGSAAGVMPASPRGSNALGDLYWEVGLMDAARSAYDAAARRAPRSFKAAVGSRLLLPAVYESVDDLERTRERYTRGLEELRAMAESFRWGTATEALSETRWTNFYLAYQGRADRTLQAEYGRLLQRILAPAMPEWFEPPAARTGGSRIRVGFASYFFYNCTAGRYFASWILGLDRERFEPYVYYTNPWEADDTRAIMAVASKFRHLPGRSLDVIARTIRADELDVLVYPELGMNADMFTLAALRLAPVQVAGWGHPTTTGHPNIDWFLSSAEMEPAGAAGQYTEKLALLPGLGTRYACPSGAEEGTRADFGLPADKHLYLVPQSIFKIHPDNDALLADVLARDPDGVLVMFAANHDVLTDRFMNRVAPHLRARGVEPARILLLPYMTHGAYLRLNRLCDVMLDTLHWSGGNTSLDALAGGLPVVTLPGELMRGRQSAGMLRMLGVEELVAQDADDYVSRAVGIARDRERREALEQRIRAGHERLFDRIEPVRAFEEFLHEAVRL